MSTRLLVLSVALTATLAAAPPALGDPTTAGESIDGVSAARTDFNGDGYADLAIGVPNEDIGSIADAGAVNVIYGSSSGLSATATADQLWSQDSPGVQDVPGGDDHFGASLTAADFDGDGFADLAIGIPGKDFLVDVGVRVKDAGAVSVIYGSPSGLTTTSRHDQYWAQNAVPGGDVAPSDSFGWSLTAGDFNGDGRADLAIGAPYEDIDITHPDAGEVDVIYGSASGLSVRDKTPHVRRHLGATLFGWSLAAADFGGSAHADLAVGAPNTAVAGKSAAGVVDVIYGSPSGLSDTSIPPQSWSQASPKVNGAPGAGDRFGWSLAAANFGGSADADLAIGVPYENIGSFADAGAVNVIYGSAGGLSATGTPDQIWHQDRPKVDDQADVDDRFGWALAAADLGGDVHADLAVGIPYETVAADDQGAVSVIYGSTKGLSAKATPDQFWTQDTPDVQGIGEADDVFGWSLSAADFGGSAQADLAIGVPYEDASAVDAGGANVIYGSPIGLSATATPDQFWYQGTVGVEGGPEEGDAMGLSLGA